MVPRYFLALFLLILVLTFPSITMGGGGNAWHSAKDTEHRLKGFGKNKRTTLQSIGQAGSGAPLQVLTIHPRESHIRPSVLVLGNMSGHSPLGTEAALRIIGQLLDADGTGETADVRWYIMPMANPDGAAAFFQKQRRCGGLNGTEVDEDRDGDFGEDPAEDLNNDGLITTMLVPDPTGRWIISEEEPLLAVKADAARGQRGLYRLETEGYDNDRDGLFNEDGPGGVNPGRNFPHGFVHWTNEGGRWAADQPETRAILEFAYDHPDIAMILVLDQPNTLRQVPKIDEKSQSGKYSVPERWAGSLGIKPGQSFSMEQLKELVSEFTGVRHVTDRQVQRYLEEDAAVSVDPKDHQWWTAVGLEYTSFLDEAGLNGERLPSPKSTAGSVEDWGYFQFGVPTFAVDFWSVPMVAEVDSLDLDEEDEAKKEEECLFSPKQKALLQYSSETADNKRLGDWLGLRPWEESRLESGEKVLIGGLAPFAMTTPPQALVDSLLESSVQYLLHLPHWLPTLGFGELEFSPRGKDVYELTVWLKNDGPIPYPTYQGLRTRRVPPIVITIEGAELLEGRTRTTLDELPAHGSARVRWLIRVNPENKLEITAEAPSLGRITKSLTATTQGGKK